MTLAIVTTIGAVVGLICVLIAGFSGSALVWSISAGVWTFTVISALFAIADGGPEIWLITVAFGIFNVIMSAFNASFA